MRSIILADVSCHLKEMFRNRHLIVWLIVIPLMISGISQLMITSLEVDDSVSATVYLQAKDPSSASVDIVRNGISEYCTLVEIDSSVDTQAFMEEIRSENPSGLTVFLILPVHFDEYVINSIGLGEFEVNVHADGLSYVVDILDSGSDDYNDGKPHIAGLYNSDEYVDKVSDFLHGNVDVHDYYFASTAVSMVLLTVLNLVLDITTEERRRRLDNLFMHSKLNDARKFISTFLWIQPPAILSFVVVYLTYGAHHFLIPDAHLIPAFLAMILFGTAFSLFVSELLYDVSSTTIVSGTILLPILILSGSIIPVQFMSDSLRSVASVIPVSHVTDVVRASFFPSDAFFTDILIILGFSAFFVVLWKAIRIYRKA